MILFPAYYIDSIRCIIYVNIIHFSKTEVTSANSSVTLDFKHLMTTKLVTKKPGPVSNAATTRLPTRPPTVSIH